MVHRRQPADASENIAPSRLGSDGNRPNSRHGADFRLLSGTCIIHHQTARRKSVQKTTIQRQIDATNRQIDQLVYELYGLTDAEIRIVEEATKR